MYERTQQRLFELENTHGYQLHVFWGHQLKERLRKDGTFRRIWDGIDVPERPLDPRKDALRGGRTEPFKLQHICAADEEIIYIDIVKMCLVDFFLFFYLGFAISLCDEDAPIPCGISKSPDPGEFVG